MTDHSDSPGLVVLSDCVPVGQLAAELGVREWTLGRWHRLKVGYRGKRIPNKRKPQRRYESGGHIEVTASQSYCWGFTRGTLGHTRRLGQ